MGTTADRQSAPYRLHATLTERQTHPYSDLDRFRRRLFIDGDFLCDRRSFHLSGLLTYLIQLVCLALSGCGALPSAGTPDFAYKNLAVADGSAVAGEGNNILFQGKPMALSGMGIKVGDNLRDVKLVQTDLSMVNINETKGKGKVRIISIVPSLDTKVCEQQTHYLSEKNKGLDRMVELITISIDTPFAQKRFAEEAKIANVTFLSDFRAADFGKAARPAAQGSPSLEPCRDGGG